MIKFYKMHGIGNDYVYIDCFSEKIEHPEELAIKLSDRHFGIGADGLILIKPSDVADCFMDMYNADGSRGKMCGNGVRCVARYLYDQGMVENSVVSIETLSGIKHLTLNLNKGLLEDITVDMGKPILIPSEIPVMWHDSSPIISEKMKGCCDEPVITCVSVGNPHAIIFVDDVDQAPVESLGKLIEMNPMFPERINVEFVQVVDKNTIKMRVWERGSGETLACGTGACASVVASVLNNVTERKVLVRLRGGDLKVEWNEETDIVHMTGSATRVFFGYIEDDFI